MKRFTYRAKDSTNKLVAGEVEANDIDSAAKIIHKKGLIVISLKSTSFNPWELIRNYQERVTPGQVATMTRQLSTMVNAGLPVTQALAILKSQAKGVLQKMLSQILSDVEGGEPFSKALSKYPKVFSTTYIALVKAGELGGVLDKVLLRLADDLENQQEFNGKVKTALIYPVIIVIGMIGVAFIMMIFVIPRLTSLYTGFNATLPLPTQILIGVSGFFARFYLIILLLVGLGIYGFNVFKKTDEGRRTVDEWIFKLPIIGELMREIYLTELTRTLALMVGAGVSILEGLTITASVIGNKVISDALRDAAREVEKGFPVSFAFARHPEAFPYILWQMIAVGEETGKMDEVLLKVSHIFEVESNEKVKNLTAAIEPLVMLILGVGVAFLVISIILPIYNITSSF